MMKHDRSILNAKGGPWATIADAVRAQTEAIVKTGRPISKPRPPAECDKLAKRREALGMTMKQFARAAEMSQSTVYTVEVGTSGAGALQRYREALEKLEELAIRQEPDEEPSDISCEGGDQHQQPIT